MPTKHFLVSGTVQGVYYRVHTKEQADKLGVLGWVCNCADGRVECMATGSAEQLRALETWMWQGSPMAQVTSVISETIENANEFDEFLIEPDKTE